VIKHSGRQVECHTVDIRVATAVEEIVEKIWQNAAGRKASVLSILTTRVWTGSPFVVPSAISKAGVAVMAQGQSAGPGRAAEQACPYGGLPDERGGPVHQRRGHRDRPRHGHHGQRHVRQHARANMLAYSEDEWRRIREQIQTTNAADRAKRS